MAGLVDVSSTAKAVREFAESLGVKINATGFAFLILVVGGLYIYYYAQTRAVEPVTQLSGRVAGLEERIAKQEASIGARFEEQMRLSKTLDRSVQETAAAFAKLTQRLEDIEDGYWIRPTISSSDEDALRSSMVLPFSRDDDVLMQVFLPKRFIAFGPDGPYVKGISLVVNGETVQLAAYTKKFPEQLPKKIFDPDRGSQEFELYFDKQIVTDPEIVNSVGMLFVIRRTMILRPASDDLATFADSGDTQ